MDAGAEIGRQGSLQVVGLGLLQHAQRPHQVAQQLGLQPVQLVPKLLVDLKNTKNPQKKHHEAPTAPQTPLFAARRFWDRSAAALCFFPCNASKIKLIRGVVALNEL